MVSWYALRTSSKAQSLLRRPRLRKQCLLRLVKRAATPLGVVFCYHFPFFTCRMLPSLFSSAVSFVASVLSPSKLPPPSKPVHATEPFVYMHALEEAAAAMIRAVRDQPPFHVYFVDSLDAAFESQPVRLLSSFSASHYCTSLPVACIRRRHLGKFALKADTTF